MLTKSMSLNESYEAEEINLDASQVIGYRVLAYTEEEIDALARGEKVLTAEEMENSEKLM